VYVKRFNHYSSQGNSATWGLWGEAGTANKSHHQNSKMVYIRKGNKFWTWT